MTTHDAQCYLNTHSLDEYMQRVRENIDEFGQHIVGVLSEGAAPGFTYTVGLLPHVGYELVVYGLPHQVSMPILNDIGRRLREREPLPFNTPDSRFTNLPVKFVECGPRAQEVNGVARRYYVADQVPMVQVVLSDRDGKFPGDLDFDHEYMDRLQPLL
jgi:hypothetical protein